jgi:segregation and condensation protein B
MTNEEAPTPVAAGHLKKRKPKLIERPEPDALLPILEAVLFVADAPVDIAALARTVNAPRQEVVERLEELGEACRERGVRLQRTGDLVQLVSAPQTAAYVERFLGLEHPPLTNASLETLAIIAYRQPLTRAGVESVRGVDCDGPIRTLMARGLIEEVGRAPVVGRPTLFGTTVRFLEYFGLEKPDDLPPLPQLEEEQEEESEEAAI